jgi:hypothetical protein
MPLSGCVHPFVRKQEWCSPQGGSSYGLDDFPHGNILYSIGFLFRIHYGDYPYLVGKPHQEIAMLNKKTNPCVSVFGLMPAIALFPSETTTPAIAEIRGSSLSHSMKIRPRHLKRSDLPFCFKSASKNDKNL